MCVMSAAQDYISFSKPKPEWNASDAAGPGKSNERARELEAVDRVFSPDPRVPHPSLVIDLL